MALLRTAGVVRGTKGGDEDGGDDDERRSHCGSSGGTRLGMAAAASSDGARGDGAACEMGHEVRPDERGAEDRGAYEEVEAAPQTMHCSSPDRTVEPRSAVRPVLGSSEGIAHLEVAEAAGLCHFHADSGTEPPWDCSWNRSSAWACSRDGKEDRSVQLLKSSSKCRRWACLAAGRFLDPPLPRPNLYACSHRLAAS
jgi:hypothetical protein